MEGQILFDAFHIGIGDEGGLAQPALALAVLALKQVACSLTPTEDLARTSDFEALGDGFPCLCFSRDSWHGAGRLSLPGDLARQKWRFLQHPHCARFLSRFGYQCGQGA
jgi:hypothetical protein